PPTADNPAPFNTIVVPDYFMSNPENSRVGTERELVRTWAGPAILDDGAANAWNEMSSANKAGVLPAIQTMV
ncbi:hypothetical protein, partial [Acinetobacter baylyi]|uniref:hypothetical protein n=1 Tax=Acinetobacter baylyi TaxID=202950 RepID=UPI0013D6CC56